MSCNSYEREYETTNMPKDWRARKHEPRPGSIHVRAGCHLSVHGPGERSHKDAACKYATHGPSPLSKLIASLSVQKRKTPNKKTKQVLSKRKWSTEVVHVKKVNRIIL